jgi:hypothetical protein
MEEKDNVAASIKPANQCRLCGSDKTKRGPGAGPHHGRLLCGGCGRFLRWLSKLEVTKGNDEKAAASAPEGWLAMPSD